MRKILAAFVALVFAQTADAQQYGPGPAPSGFPILLGSTSIPAKSTTTVITGLSIAAGGSNTLTASSFAGNGCTIGTDVICGTGSETLSGLLNAGGVNVTGSTVPANGMFLRATNTIDFATNSLIRWDINSIGQITNVANSNGVQISGGTATCTAPSLIPNRSATTTGFSGDGTKLCGVVAGVDVVDWTATRETVFGGFTWGAALTSNNPGTAGFSLIQTAANLTDSGTTGTTAALYGNVFGGNTILATNTKTYTNEYGSYFKADIAGTGATLSSIWALGADSARIGGTTISSTGLITAAGQIVAANMTQTSAAQSGTVCWAASGLTYDATLGCLASLPELKDFRGKITGALSELDKLQSYWASWKTNSPEWKGGDHSVQPVFNAREVEKVDKRLVAYGPDGKLRGVRYMEMTAFQNAVLKEQQAEILSLKAANDNLSKRLAKLERRR